jgi:hypothetical protein
MASLSRRHPGSRSSCRDVFGISEQLVIEEITVMITSRKAAKMTAADVNKHTMNHWESRTRAATSVTPSTGRITTRHGAGTGHHARASRITSPSARKPRNGSPPNEPEPSGAWLRRATSVTSDEPLDSRADRFSCDPIVT